MRLLLKAGLDPNIGSQSNGRLPLGYAAVHGLTTVMEELLAHGADPKRVGDSGFSAFHEAIDRGQVEVLDLLVRKEPSLLELINRPVPRSGRTPLHIAALGFFAHDPHFVAPDYGTTVSWLVARGAKLEAISEGMTPLILAAKSENLPALSALLTAGADVNARNTSGMTALLWAVTKKNYPMVQKLLEHRADLNLGDILGITPLSTATGAGSAPSPRCSASTPVSAEAPGQAGSNRAWGGEPRWGSQTTVAAAWAANCAPVRLGSGALPAMRGVIWFH